MSPPHTAMSLDPRLNPALFWSMAYKLSDAVTLLLEGQALARLAESPASAATLAEALGWQTDPLTRLLDLLTSAGVLLRQGDRYAVPPATAAVLPVMAMEAQVRRWHAANGSLRRMVETGQGADPLGRIEEPAFHSGYQQAMAASTRALALHLFRHAGLTDGMRVLDLGGADGALAEQLARLMPNARFCVVDRPPVEPHFMARMAARAESLGPAEAARCRFVAEDVTRADRLLTEAAESQAVILSNLLHMIPQPAAQGLLAALHQVLPPGARLIVYDQFVLPDHLDVAGLMTVDWVNLGTLFDGSDAALSAHLIHTGWHEVSARRFPLLPGALVCAATPNAS
ncbi:class I SAM-dependent methyltransferase [Roseateles amylovorans]|uniref:Class I SAM-dependent methyltransferase n=1 Tax=Roseateles amylovorans TaxID=2978473 RepID=A0ABY6ATI6_9BURK|nr:class I SAM-dependent methyltransferase [Roseateles amylovorans]UXH76090.1 class I SAM-dependent methyltransferase [Roseateles amylovorans]